MDLGWVRVEGLGTSKKENQNTALVSPWKPSGPKARTKFEVTNQERFKAQDSRGSSPTAQTPANQSNKVKKCPEAEKSRANVARTTWE